MKNILHTKIYFEDLPHYETGRYQGKINWKLVTGCKVRFEYNDIKDIITILSYDNSSKKIQIEYDGKVYEIYQSSFMRKQISCAIGKKVIGFRYQVGDRITDEKHDITIIDKTQIDNKRKYQYKCNLCGNVDWCFEKIINDGKYICNACSGQKVVCGINDIPTTDPWMIPYFQGGYEEAKLFSNNSKHNFNPVCPYCNKIKKNKMAIYTLKRTKSIGCNCGDGISYPNKFMYKLLEQLGVEFIDEFSPEWIKPKRYDFYIPLKNLIIEMDGGLGHGKKIYSRNSVDLQESLNVDMEKDFIAYKHGIRVIRIPSDKSDMDYIVNNIINSLSNIIDLSEINWEECEKYALSNRVKFVCDFYEKNKPISPVDIQEKLNINRNVVTSYLKKGNRLGWTDYDPKLSKIYGRKKAGEFMKKTYSKITYVYDISGNYIREYPSMHDIQEHSIRDFGFFLSFKVISKVCNHKMNSYKGLIFTFEKDNINLNCRFKTRENIS